MSRESITIEWTAAQRKKLQPLFDEIWIAAIGKGANKCDGLLDQVFTYGMEVRYIANEDVLKIQRINRIAQKKGRQIK